MLKRFTSVASYKPTPSRYPVTISVIPINLTGQPLPFWVLSFKIHGLILPRLQKSLCQLNQVPSYCQTIKLLELSMYNYCFHFSPRIPFNLVFILNTPATILTRASMRLYLVKSQGLFYILPLSTYFE